MIVDLAAFRLFCCPFCFLHSSRGPLLCAGCFFSAASFDRSSVVPLTPFCFLPFIGFVPLDSHERFSPLFFLFFLFPPPFLRRSFPPLGFSLLAPSAPSEVAEGPWSSVCFPMVPCLPPTSLILPLLLLVPQPPCSFFTRLLPGGLLLLRPLLLTRVSFWCGPLLSSPLRSPLHSWSSDWWLPMAICSRFLACPSPHPAYCALAPLLVLLIFAKGEKAADSPSGLSPPRSPFSWITVPYQRFPLAGHLNRLFPVEKPSVYF